MNRTYEIRTGEALISRTNMAGVLTEIHHLNANLPSGVVEIEGRAFHLGQITDDILRRELETTGSLHLDFGGGEITSAGNQVTITLLPIVRL